LQERGFLFVVSQTIFHSVLLIRIFVAADLPPRPDRLDNQSAHLELQGGATSPLSR
jgi:hypothetical protein